jgi:diaminohydroxyphosphoribosylaminopyrimidine deaminase/5-amino-6-(5-phosphoribosylamino)uracil reductase
MVGCLIARKDKIIGQGFTSPYGGPHAEVNAIASVKDKSLLADSTLYVTLEPCSHHGKTPPCSDLIIAHNIPKVVIGATDTSDKVSGQGIEGLRQAGIEVITGVLEAACRELHKRFFTYHNKRRPHIILKWARTANGLIAPLTRNNRKPVWITNPVSRQQVHKWRAEEQAILVGTNTVLQDNPSLTVRNWHGENPVRIVIDRHNKLSRSLNVFNDKAPTLTLSEDTLDFERPLAKQICEFLHGEGINSVIIEGGRQTLQTFIDEDLWDEARVFTGAVEFKEGIKEPVINGSLVSESYIMKDRLNIYKND